MFAPRPFKKICFGLAILMLMVILRVGKLWAQVADPSPINFPTPKNIDNMLFYLQRDPNTNTLIYALNMQENGSINHSQPVAIYWIRYGEHGEKKELSYIQKKFAYGLITKEIAKDKFELKFVSHKALPIYLSKVDQKYIVTIAVNGKTVKINRLFVRIVGGSFWLPNVRYALIEGSDLTTGKSITEKILIK
ncbi:DUF4833 domain-containing protein [Pedobacter agri]|uniref:DUF4833 domain-containing protein n=1 Tax=Pedobacter agri TaxID=454586 RepID=UPI00292EC24C|nr:DUF4833 domain-containing protein [Pedobacter agri]